jgi:hypothetical protein
MICLSYYLYVFSSTKWENKRAEQVLPRRGMEELEVAQTMYIYVNKCKKL